MRRLFNRRGARAGSSLSAAALAPLVDMLTILLVVILRTWSIDPPLQFSEEGLRLPISTSELPVARALAVDVGRSGLYVDGWRAGSATYWRDSDEVLIRDLYDALQGRGGDTVLVRADQDAPWSLVGKVLFTAQQAGYRKIELVATSRASL